MNPQDFTAIKDKIQSSTILSAQEKQEWLFLLPRMSTEELKELDRILSVKSQAPARTPADFTPTSADKSLDIRSRGPRRPEFASAPQDIPNTALTKISGLVPEDIRKPPSIYVCLENVHKEIEEIIKKTDINRRQILEAFQRSPLYRDYLRSGIKLINNDPTASLSHEEFEAISDFHEILKAEAKI